jgi:hypothetical protein
MPLMPTMPLIDFESFSQPLKFFLFYKKDVFPVIFGQKAWTIAHGFDEFWFIFTPF